jgi:hypothetical protein
MAALRRIARTPGFRHVTDAVRLFVSVAQETRRMQNELAQRYPGSQLSE